MKTLSKILVVALFSSSVLFAGGAFVAAPAPEPDTEPVEPAVAEIPQAPAAENNLKPYFGAGVGSSSTDVHSQAKVCGGCQYDKLNQTSSKAPDKILNWGGSGSAGTGTALAGVEVNDFLAIEGRLTKTISDYEIKDHKPISATNAAVYLKPQYKFEAATLYALLGYGVTKLSFMGNDTTVNGLQYGAGGSYDINDELSVFADYTKLYGGGDKISKATTAGGISSVNAGVIFKP